MLSNSEELGYINKTLQGNSNAFRPVVEQYYPAVRAVVSRYLADKSLVEDLCQETFIRAFKGLPTYKSSNRFVSWLLKIAVNTSLEFLRKNKGKNSLAIPANLISAGSHDPESVVAERSLFDDCLDQLSLSHKVILLLRHGLELSYEEMALVLDVSVPSVKSDLFRLRSRLKSALADKNAAECCSQAGE